MEDQDEAYDDVPPWLPGSLSFPAPAQGGPPKLFEGTPLVVRHCKEPLLGG